MPTLKSLKASKTFYGWSTIEEYLGYTAEAGDLTVAIRHHFRSQPPSPLPGWQSKILDDGSGPSGYIVTLDWTTEAFSGSLDVQARNCTLAVFTPSHIGNVLVQSTPSLAVGPPEGGTPFDAPVVEFSASGSCVFSHIELQAGPAGGALYTGQAEADNGATGITYIQEKYPWVAAVATAATQTPPKISLWVRKNYTVSADTCAATTFSIEIKDGPGEGPGGGGGGSTTPVDEKDFTVNVCGNTVAVVGGVRISTRDFVNAQDLINTVGSDDSDPIADEYEGYVANGKNTRGTKGIQDPLPTQTELPDPSPVAPKEADEAPPSQPQPTPVGCTTWVKGDYDAVMSKNFILRNFTVGYSDKKLNMSRGCLNPNPLIDIAGYTAQVRFCNLQALAQNVLEPLWAKYGEFRINSGIRNQNSVKNGVSQHVTGEAVDVQFNGWNYAMYWEAAKWVKDNLPYDQFIFEHSSKTGLAWLHLSFRRSGNRPASDPTKVMTMYRGNYDKGLRRYG